MGHDSRVSGAAHIAAALAAAAKSPYRIVDRFNRPLMVGGTYEFHSTLPILFTIESLKPVLDPRAPAGLFEMIASAKLLLTIKDGVPEGRLTLVAAPQEAAENGNSVREAEPTPAAGTEPPAPAGPSLITLTDAPNPGPMHQPIVPLPLGDPDDGQKPEKS